MRLSECYRPFICTLLSLPTEWHTIFNIYVKTKHKNARRKGVADPVLISCVNPDINVTMTDAIADERESTKK